LKLASFDTVPFQELYACTAALKIYQLVLIVFVLQYSS